MNVAAVVLAAGAGRRMRSDQPKQFLQLAGRPLFMHSLEFFLRLEAVGHVCLVLNPEALEGDEAEAARALAREIQRPLSLACGGARRQDSTLSGLRAVPEDTRIVLVHDAARPFPPPEAVAHSIEEADLYGGAILAAPVVETVKQVEPGGLQIAATLNRDQLYLAQTPQTFQYRALIEALEAVEREGLDVTDEAMAFERLGRAVRIVPSTAENLKVTVPEDLPRAEALAARRRDG